MIKRSDLYCLSLLFLEPFISRRLFHAKLDLICIRNSDHNPPEYYSTTGVQVQFNQFDASEIQYELREAGEEFRQLVARLREDENPDAEIQNS